MTTVSKTIFVPAVLVALSATAAPAQVYVPYIGVWDCGVGIFTFTTETYNPGDGLMVASDIEPDGDDNFIMTFPDGYQIGLSNVGDETMQWLSMETGDMFDCTRLYR